MAHITLLSQIARGAGCVPIGRNGSADEMLDSGWLRLKAGPANMIRKSQNPLRLGA